MPENEQPPLEIDAEFDRLLRSALSSYADPDEALTERVLARVAAEPQRERGLRWLPWAIAVPIAAGLLIFIVFFGSHQSHQPDSHTDQAHVLQPPASPNGDEQHRPSNSAPERRTEISRVKAHPHSSQRALETVSLPKLAVFPTPQPLNPAERALAEYAAHAPQVDRQALLEAQKQMDEPLSIAAIEIQPLEPPDGGGN